MVKRWLFGASSGSSLRSRSAWASVSSLMATMLRYSES